jgi:metal-responsive CopG/Arc/MetJ family transcriptional regulator
VRAPLGPEGVTGMNQATTKEQREIAVLTRFRPELGEELDRVRLEEGRTRAGLVRQAVRQYVEARRSRQPRPHNSSARKN